MHTLKTAIALAWIPFWIYWLLSSTTAKESRPGRRWTPVGGVSAVGVILIGVFYYAASVEERNMTAALPTEYPAYRTSTKMLIPFIL